MFFVLNFATLYPRLARTGNTTSVQASLTPPVLCLSTALSTTSDTLSLIPLSTKHSA